MSLAQLCNEDAAVAARCAQAFTAVRQCEDAHVVNPLFYDQVVLQQRPQVVTLALKYGESFGLADEAVFDGLQLFDKAMSSGAAISPDVWPLVLAVCVALVTRQAMPTGTWLSHQEVSVLTGFSLEAVAGIEQSVLIALRSDVTCLTVLRVMHLINERLGYSNAPQGPQTIDGRAAFTLPERAASHMQSLVTRLAVSPVMMGMRSSVVACGALVSMRRACGLLPFWPMCLQLMTGYTLAPGTDMAACLQRIEHVEQAQLGGMQQAQLGGGMQQQAQLGGGMQQQAQLGGGMQQQAQLGGMQPQAQLGGMQPHAQLGGMQPHAQLGGMQAQAQLGSMAQAQLGGMQHSPYVGMQPQQVGMQPASMQAQYTGMRHTGMQHGGMQQAQQQHGGQLHTGMQHAGMQPMGMQQAPQQVGQLHQRQTAREGGTPRPPPPAPPSSM
ncbi:hypothetical protein FOA52_009098 [Chlamydomonas sp. UWO 241]|nr:hypothetical protein FOA52_009098 [Chlamydomonas sp. UWO 241]